MGLASRAARRAGALDRGPARAPRRAAPPRPGASTEVEAGFTRDGELVALRYDAIEDVGAYVRAPEPATLYRMHGSLSGAYRVRNVAARNRVVLTNTIPSGLNRGFGGPQLYFGLERTMAIAARRLGLDPAELARRNLDARGRDAVPDAVGCALRLRRLRGCLDEALELAGYDELRARARGARERRAARRRRPRVRRRAVDLEHGLHHARADRRRARADAAEVRQRRGRVDRDRPARRDHGPARHDAAGPGAPHGRAPRSSPTSSAARRRTSPCCPRWTRRPCRGRSPRATTPRASRASASGRSQAAARKLRAKVDAIREHAGDPEPVAAPCRGDGALESRRAAGRARSPGLTAVAFWAAPNLDPPDAEDRVASSARARLHRRRLRRRGRPRDRRA